MLAVAQTVHGELRRGVADQMKAADAFERDDHFRVDGPDRERNRIADVNRLPVVRKRRQPRAARRTGIRLRVEAAIGRRAILSLALRAQRETGHRRVRAVVRHVADDRVARAAVRAVSEGVAVTAIVGIERLRETLRTGREIGRNGHAPFGRVGARRDREFGDVLRWQRRNRQRLDARGRRCVVPETAHELFELLVLAEDVDGHAARGIRDLAAHTARGGDAIDPRPEADTLYCAADLDPPSFQLHHTATIGSGWYDER